MTSCWTRFRLNGIRPAKALVATTADIAGDWMFYESVKRLGGDFEKYEYPLFAFAAVSSVMGVILVLVLVMNMCNARVKNSKRKKYFPFLKPLKYVLGLEIFIEDIPQFIITVLVSMDRGAISTYAVFNFTTSGINFFLSLLDMIEIEDSDETGFEYAEADANV